MAAVDDPKTLGRTRLSFANEAEIDEFAATLDKFERGELTPDQWRAYRLVRGNYGQRQDVVQMVRVKIPQGISTPPSSRRWPTPPTPGRGASATSPRARTSSSTSSSPTTWRR